MNFPISTKIDNKNLAGDLELESGKFGGVLTYAQFQNIAQYGKYGYQAKFNKQGKTDVHLRWPKILARLCVQNNLHQIFEFGSGDGSLGVETVRECLRISDGKIAWSGVEINENLRELTKKTFSDQNLKSCLAGMFGVTDKLQVKSTALVVLAYSLDSLCPEQFINTLQQAGSPNGRVGLEVKNGRLTEKLIHQEKQENFDLSSWKLGSGQRAFINLAAYATVRDLERLMPPGSVFVFIDEFRPKVSFWERGALGLPKDLYAHSKDCTDLTKHYRQAGERLLYFPLYFDAFLRFLPMAGFRDIRFDFEKKMVSELSGKSWFSLHPDPWTFAFLATNSGKRTETVNIYPPSVKFL